MDAGIDVEQLPQALLQLVSQLVSQMLQSLGQLRQVPGIDVEQLPQALQQLVSQLRQVPPTIREVDLGGPKQGGDYFRMHPPAALAGAELDDGTGALWCRARLWVLGLIGSCPSLRDVKLANCGICSESEVERLCQGLKSNKVLRWLSLDGNVGFGSDFGCRQVSHILASSSTSLEALDMDGVGLEAAGLSQVLSTLLANTASRLQILDLEHNPKCLADERAVKLLTQLVSDPRTSKCLRRLRIRETGLEVAGAALLSAALGAHDHNEEENTALESLQVGGPEPILNVIVSSLSTCSPSVVDFLFSREEEAGPLAETLAQMLRTNTHLRALLLEEAHFSTQAWRCVFQALGANSTLSFLTLQGSPTLDHSVMDDLHQLLASNPGLTICLIKSSPLKGGSSFREPSILRGFFYCSCSSCNSRVTRSAKGEGAEGNVEHLPQGLRPLIAALTAVHPSIEEVDLHGLDHGAVGEMFRMDPDTFLDTSHMLWELRLLVLGLIGRCPSLRRVKLDRCNISRESEVERLCQGLTFTTVLEHLSLNQNLGFGSDFGCQQLSHILASSSSRLERLDMDGVGLGAAGLSQVLSTLLANKGSRLQVLEVGNNPECLADERAAELLSQLVSNPRTSKCLRWLGIRKTGLAVAGAALLSAALSLGAPDRDEEESTALEKLQVGSPEPRE